ncbi:MAG: tetratricopeptide repeat protein, partial [Campylobacter concisus]|nr:tetratricopeptide repeat protein [Campylobacter concisus]
MLRKILFAISLVVLAACATTMDDADDYSIAAYEYYQNGNYSKAIEAYTKALEIQENILGRDDIKNAVIYNNMGLAYAFMG